MANDSNGCGGAERCGCGTKTNRSADVESTAETSEWAATVPAATVATPLADATELAGLLLE
ncbi:hypothetical protein [Natrarchaeobius chitinivorans]|uniref:Uncharacterized protein n=1 Tax=Natrarchaeobius chitinivorans TaxID=1679083 RepID=A0A3N6LRL2_NATCH|nr:hypothetical protein [Natrarchaeobius chitinivorans]RQG92403.1 hypothetical protein EA473_16650 [Natrarchaeobius chitinivorans]